jgi:peptidoglycan/LPS O-acetylase OafA/YrhL
MIALLFLCFPGYVLAQVLAFRRLRRVWLWVALLPAVVMALVVISSVVAFTQDSPQWPLLILFLSPIALLFVVMLMVIHGIVQSRHENHVA